VRELERDTCTVHTGPVLQMIGLKVPHPISRGLQDPVSFVSTIAGIINVQSGLHLRLTGSYVLVIQ